MTTMQRRVFLACAGAPLIPIPSLSAACDDREKTNNPYRYSLQPGATMSISVQFNSGWTNAMSLVDVRTGTHFAAWRGCGNRDNVSPKSYTYMNPEQAAIPFLISHGYKPTPADDPNVQWCKNAAKVKSYSDQAVTFGYTDSTSPDYANCTITLTITSGKLPQPQQNQ
jgi:hypothetical protein